jgi:O-antigen/teichoic acid export membrane protein
LGLSIILLVLTLLFAKRRYNLPADSSSFNGRRVWKLLKANTPLFIAAFLLFYIINAPRYTLDAFVGDAAQAVYGFISMPIFVVSLFTSFVYAPMITPLSQLWQEQKVLQFKREFAKQTLWTLLISIGCVAAAWLLGVPVLNWLYNTDVSAYLLDLCILVAGGGFLGFVTLFTMGVTIVRKQNWLTWSYCAVTVLAFFMTSWAVRSWGIDGASWVYLLLMIVLAVATFATLLVGVRFSRIKPGS